MTFYVSYYVFNNTIDRKKWNKCYFIPYFVTTKKDLRKILKTISGSSELFRRLELQYYVGVTLVCTNPFSITELRKAHLYSKHTLVTGWSCSWQDVTWPWQCLQPCWAQLSWHIYNPFWQTEKNSYITLDI